MPWREQKHFVAFIIIVCALIRGENLSTPPSKRRLFSSVRPYRGPPTYDPPGSTTSSVTRWWNLTAQFYTKAAQKVDTAFFE